MMASMASTEEIMRGVAKAVDQALNGSNGSKEYGFAILIFPFGATEDGRVNYVSNAERRDMIAALKEITAHFEGKPHTQGRT